MFFIKFFSLIIGFYFYGKSIRLGLGSLVFLFLFFINLGDNTYFFVFIYKKGVCFVILVGLL